MNSRKSIIGIVLLVGVVAFASFTNAQQSGLFYDHDHDHDHPTLLAQQSGGFGSLRLRSTDAMKKKWQAADEDERDELIAKTRNKLEAQFDKDFAQREKEIDELEARVDKLRAQLRRRSDKRDDIVDLRLKQMTMSWEGLGWNDSNSERMHIVSGLAETHPSGTHSFSVWRSDDEDVDETLEIDLDDLAEESSDEIEDIVEAFVDSASELDPNSTNSYLWELVTTDDLELSKDLWLKAAKIAKDAADEFEATRDPGSKANTLDTAAHLYQKAGRLEKAISLQELAVELSNDSQLTSYLKALKFKKKEQSLDDDEK